MYNTLVGRRGSGGPRSPSKTDWVMGGGGYLIGLSN